MTDAFDALFANRAVFLAPMEDVSDAAFRRVCRARGAAVCFTEFVRVEHAIDGEAEARRKLSLADDDRPTGVQIYGADAALLAEAATRAERARPSFVDINCGCWIPRVAARGAGAAWLREPDAMVAMAREVVRRCALPVTVKTRIGLGHEPSMPIVDLARRLEDAGVRALTIHCRTAAMGHEGAPDWSWAARAREAVRIPVVVNGGIATAADARRAFEQTGCAAVMIGRRAIDHPWIFAEARALLDTGTGLPRPTPEARLALCRAYLHACLAERGERAGVRHARRMLPGFVRPLPGGRALGETLRGCDTRDAVEEALSTFTCESADGMRSPMRARHDEGYTAEG